MNNQTMMYLTVEDFGGFQHNFKIGFYMSSKQLKEYFKARGYCKILSKDKAVYDSPNNYRGEHYLDLYSPAQIKRLKS